MAEVLVLVDHLAGDVRKSTLEMLTIARRLGTPSAVFCGSLSDGAKARLSEFGILRIEVVVVLSFEMTTRRALPSTSRPTWSSFKPISGEIN